MDHRPAPADVAAAEVVAQSLGHLIRLIRPNGRFVYAHPVGQPDQPLDGYNMLRHCGTLWFMLRAVNDLGLDPGPAGWSALEAALDHAAGKMQRPVWLSAPGPCLALVTRDAVKTGGVGLALVMLAEYRRAGRCAAGAVADTIAGLTTYALAQIEGDDFLHKRRFSDGTVLPFRSDYYTGEVLLGLFVTGCTDPAVIAVAEGLMAQRYGLAEQSHWMAYAACEAAERGLGDPALVRSYIAALIGEIIGNDAYRHRGTSTPIACRTEALTRFLLLTDMQPGVFPPDLIAASRSAATENLALQRGWYAKGQFWKGDDDAKVQIDYIQHNATAFLNLCLHDRARARD
jgi:hypothetical protein